MIKRVVKFTGIALIILGIFIPTFMVSKNKIAEIKYEKKIVKKIEQKKYFAIIEIPKISLKRELFSISSKENDVEKNIFVQEKSIFPENNQKSHIILASHSGYGANAYFKNLYKLEIRDRIKVYYENKIYEYEILEIEFQKKTGHLSLKEIAKDQITLITCTHNDNNTQTIYYGDLKTVEKA